MVVQDVFLTETAELADVVLPGARPGARRPGRSPTPTARCTCPSKAVDPPGEARADLEIFLDYARRMDFRDRDGAPLIEWDDAGARLRGLEGVLARAAVRLQRASPTTSCAAQRASSGRAPSERPDGTERLYDGRRLQHRSGLLRDATGTT